MIDPRIASLLSPKAKFNAGLRALGELSSQLVNRGAPRYSPTPPPMNLGRVMDAYNSTIENDLQRGMAMHQFKRSEDDYARKEMQRDAIANALKPQTVETMDRDGAQITTQKPSALMETLPAALRPAVLALAKQGNGQQALNTVLGAALKPPSKGTALMQEAKLIHPNDPEGQAAYVLEARSNSGVSVNVNSGKPRSIIENAAEKEFGEAAETASGAGAKLLQLNQMRDLLATNVPTGKIAEQTLAVQKVLSGLGVTNANLPIQEAIASLGKELALAKHGPGMGPMTDKDFEIYQNIVPRLGATKAGNNLIMRRLEREYRGQQMYAAVLRRQILSVGGLQNFDTAKAWRQVASALDNELGQLIPTFATEADFAKTGNKYVGQIVSVAGKGFEVLP